MKIVILIISFTVWLALAVFAYINANKAFKKYQKVKKVQNQSQFAGVIRTDYGKWPQSKILLGCFTKFPYKVFGVLAIVFGTWVMSYLQPILKLINKNYDKIYVKYIGRLAARSIYTVQEIGDIKDVQTPILISNHVNWFDIIYLSVRFYPISFVSKAELEKAPLVGRVAKFIQCIFVERNNVRARQMTLERIKERIDAYQSDSVSNYPLIIYPEGTTTNGKAIIKFKIGAFHDKAPITIIGLTYRCQGFDMGMDEITPIEHFVISTALTPHVTVKAKKVEAKFNENANDYMKRCQQQLKQLTGYPILNIGMAQKMRLKQIRGEKKQQ